MNLKLLSFLIFITTSSLAQVKKPDSLQLFFDSAKYQLTEDHKTSIAEFVKGINPEEVQQIHIKGYTDFVGDHVFNNKLSKKRAKTVYNYIAQNYTFDALVQQGLGELNDQNERTTTDNNNGIDEHRKVDIIMSYEKPKTIFISLNRRQKYLSDLPRLTVGEKLRLRNINFQISTTTLTKISEEDLDGITKILKAYPKTHISIEGHVCCGSKEEYETKKADSGNLKLSTERAKTIYNELIKRGIKAHRLSYIGYGFTRPLDFPESTVDIQKENRRIELKVLKQ